MNHDAIELENLRRAVSGVAGMTPNLAQSLPSLHSEQHDVTLDDLREIDHALDVCKFQNDFLSAFGKLVEGVTARVRSTPRRSFTDILDREGKLAEVLQDGINQLASLADSVEQGTDLLERTLEDAPDAGVSDVVEGFREYIRNTRDTIDLIAQLRTTVVAHDESPVQLELSAEQVEQMKHGLENPKAPEAGFAVGVRKFRDMLAQGRSLFN